MDLNYFKLPWYKKLIYNLSKFFKNLGHEFVAFWRGLFKIIINFFVGCGKKIKEFALNFYRGNLTTKISYLFLGVGHFFRGQKVRGILYFLLEVFFILYIALFGGRYLTMFLENMFTGGNVGRVETQDFWNEEEGIWERTADNTSSGRKCRDKMTEAEKVKMAEARKRWEEATPEEKREFNKYLVICLFILFAMFAGVFVLIVLEIS